MKKYKFLIISIILLILSFLNNWYRDQILNYLFIFSLISTFILLIVYVICIVFTIRDIIKSRNLINIITIMILCIIPIMLLLFPFRISKVKFEYNLFERQRIEIINMVKTEKITPDELGNAELPNQYKRLSTSGEIHIYQNDERGIVIGFWVFRGMISGSTELIYSSKDDELIKENETGHPIFVIQKLDNHWYYVKTDY